MQPGVRADRGCPEARLAVALAAILAGYTDQRLLLFFDKFAILTYTVSLAGNGMVSCPPRLTLSQGQGLPTDVPQRISFHLSALTKEESPIFWHLPLKTLL